MHVSVILVRSANDIKRYPEVIIDALILGYNEGLDILSLSLGGADGWTEGISSVVASNIAATGVIVTISAGNSVSLHTCPCNVHYKAF